jgi:ABC-2 type transport system permease protein
MSTPTHTGAGTGTGTGIPAQGGRPTEASRGQRGHLAGTGALLRFALRRERLRSPVWIVALLLGTLSTVTKLQGLYPHAAGRASLARTLDSPAGLAMTGPAHYLHGPGGYTLGAMLSHQVIGFITVLVALMSVQIVVRHTRAEEETGRAELLRSTVVGRHASLTAALVLAVIVNLVLAALLTLGLGALGAHGGSGISGLSWGGSLLYGLVHAGVGIVFAGVAAATVQITEHARAASGMALVAIGAAFVLRAAGDVGGGTLSWLSPIGWAQRSYPYLDDRWWPLSLMLAAALVTGALGYVLSVRRDVGLGLRPAKRGRREATHALTHPLGFALRLQRGTLAAFAAALLVLGAMYGSILGDVEGMLKNVPAVDGALKKTGGSSLVESFASIVMIVNAVIAAVCVVLAVLRPRAEEDAGRAEALLATGLSRTRWVASHLIVGLLGGTLAMLLSGVGFGLAGAASTGEHQLMLSLPGAALAYAPALWVTGGVAVLLFGWLPRASAAAWLVPVYAFVVGYLGQILQFPGWLNDISPFGHVPELPANDMRWTPMVVLTAVAVALLSAGLVGLRRRDLETK